MTSGYSEFFTLKEAVVYLLAKGWTEVDARDLLVSGIRDGKLATREWERDEGVGRLVVVRGEKFDWTTLLDEDIDWERSSVVELMRQSRSEQPYEFSHQYVDRYRVDKLEIGRIDLAKFLSEIQEFHGADSAAVSASTKESKQSTRGRKSGDGTINDEKHFTRMKELIKSGKANSANDAARRA